MHNERILERAVVRLIRGTWEYHDAHVRFKWLSLRRKYALRGIPDAPVLVYKQWYKGLNTSW